MLHINLHLQFVLDVKESSISQNRSRSRGICCNGIPLYRDRSQPARFYLRFVARDGNKGKQLWPMYV